MGAVIRYTSIPNNKSTANLSLTTNGTFPDAVVVHVTEFNEKDNTSVTKLVRYEFETVVSNSADEALLEKTVSIHVVVKNEGHCKKIISRSFDHRRFNKN